MPSKTSKKKPAALPTIPKELLDHIADGPMTADAVNAASMAFKKALIEGAGRRTQPSLGLRAGADKPEGTGNHRNGGPDGRRRAADRRSDDRQGNFEPLLISKHERCITGLDDKIVAMYARGMTIREIQGIPGRAIWPPAPCLPCWIVSPWGGP